MGVLELDVQTVPSTPAANKVDIYPDSADRRLKMIDQYGTVTVLSPDGTNFVNFLDNGGFAVNKRITAALTTLSAANGGAPSATARVATIDRWPMVTQTVSAPQAQWVDTITAAETGISARFYMRYKQITGAGKQMYTQTINGTDTARLRGRVVRFQAKLRLSVGSNKILKMGVVQNNSASTVDVLAASFVPTWNGNGADPTLGTNLAYIVPASTALDNCTVVGSGLSCNVTSTWQRFSGIFTVPTDCRNLTVIIWSDSQMAVNDDNLLTELGVYIGQEIMDWSPIPLEVEVDAAERYFSKSFPMAVVPAASVAIATGGHGCTGILGKAGSGTVLGSQITIQFLIRMYKVPTVVLFTPIGAGAVVYRVSGVTPAVQGATTVLASSITDRGCVVTATNEATTNGVIGDLVAIHFTADSEI